MNPYPITPLLADDERLIELESRVPTLYRLDVNDRTASDVELLGNGGYSPLEGFMAQEDYLSVVESMRTAKGDPWSVPITLPVTMETARGLEIGEEIALWYGGRAIAVMQLREKFTYEKAYEARNVYRTEDVAHPGVANLMRQGEMLLGGPVEVLVDDIHTSFGRYRYTPTQLRAAFERRGWERVVAFQTRNPIHRAHEYLNKCALEMVDGLLIHPLVGETKGDDIPADVRMRCYEVILDKYYPQDRTMLSVFPASMRYAGPREAIFHALVRRNYGCTHFIVGRDHAGVGNYYGTYDAQKIFGEFKEGELGITPVFFDYTFYCKACGHIASDKTCVHDPVLRIFLSGTKVREMLRAGKNLPPEFSRPEVARILLEAHNPELREERENRERALVDEKHRVMVIGLDAAPPSLLFERFRDRLPNLSRLMDSGAYGPLESCDPPVTIPAWACMTAAKDPGQLGIYGFMDRKSYAYDDLSLASSSSVQEKRVWDLLTEAGKKCVVVGVPGTYPPTPLEGGHMVSCFLTPNTAAPYTHPPALKAEIEQVVGKYVLDVENFKSGEKDAVLRQIYEMTDRRFRLAQHLVTEKAWDFFMLVEMGPDRLHHAFWRHVSPTHPGYEEGNPLERTLLEYYVYLDHQVGELLKILPEHTTVMIVSDHGVQDARGSVCINEWLIENGWLTLNGDAPAEPTPFAKLDVDWSRTKAWAQGGDYARIHLNVKGREPQGVIDQADYAATRDELARTLQGVQDQSGGALENRVVKPDERYSGTKNIAPDLIAYFGGMAWRAAGTVGHGALAIEGDDDATHDGEGAFIMGGPGAPGSGKRLDGLRLYDVAPTILKLFDQDIPADMLGSVISD